MTQMPKEDFSNVKTSNTHVAGAIKLRRLRWCG